MFSTLNFSDFRVLWAVYRFSMSLCTFFFERKVYEISVIFFFLNQIANIAKK